MLQLRKGSTDNLSWGLVTITVASESDLQRMREALASHIEYVRTLLSAGRMRCGCLGVHAMLGAGVMQPTAATCCRMQHPFTRQPSLSTHQPVLQFEADLTGFTTIRALKEAATSGKATGFNITTQPAVVDGSQPAQRPNWARSIDADEELPSWVGRSRAEVRARMIRGACHAVCACG